MATAAPSHSQGRRRTGGANCSGSGPLLGAAADAKHAAFPRVLREMEVATMTAGVDHTFSTRQAQTRGRGGMSLPKLAVHPSSSTCCQGALVSHMQFPE